MLLEKDDLGHWKFGRKLDPDKHFGFLYCITNHADGRFYIGRKNFLTQGKKTIKHKTTGKRVPNPRRGKDTGWKTYMGSSAHVEEDIKKHGEDAFEFEMIDVYDTYGGLYYAEAFTQMLTECMTQKKSCGEIPLFYNRQIAAIRFVPKELPTRKTRQFISKLKRKYPT